MNHNRLLERRMRKFLKQLYKNKPINYDDPIIRQCVYECYKKGYVSGYYGCARSSTNDIIFDYTNPQVEKSGLEFLYPDRDWTAIWTLIISAITAIGVLLQLILTIVK